MRLTNAYAAEFRRYKHQLDMGSVTEALGKIEAVIRQLRASGQAGSDSRLVQLRQMQAELRNFGVQLRNTMIVQAADSATSFRPHPLRNGLIGGAIGALLGVVVILGVRRRTRAGR